MKRYYVLVTPHAAPRWWHECDDRDAAVALREELREFNADVRLAVAMEFRAVSEVVGRLEPPEKSPDETAP